MKLRNAVIVLLAGAILIGAITFVLTQWAGSSYSPGSGFGTRFAQATMWWSWRLVRGLTGRAPSELATTGVWAVINASVWLIIGGIAAGITSKARPKIETGTILASFCIFLIILLLWPQATYGP